MRGHLLVGSFALAAASLGLAATPAAAWDDDCGCGYSGYSAGYYGYGAGYYGAGYYGYGAGYVGGYYGGPAYSYYAAPIYAAPVYYPAPSYYAAPAYYAPPAYYPPPGYYGYGRPYYGWRGGYVDAGHARGKGNFVPPNAAPRGAYALNKGPARVGRALSPAPPVAAPRAAYALNKGPARVGRVLPPPPLAAAPRAAHAPYKGPARVGRVPPPPPPVAIPPMRVERARAADPGLRGPSAVKPRPLPVKQPTVTASPRDGAQMVRFSNTGGGRNGAQIATVRRQDR